jgi:hypothetical protein
MGVVVVILKTETRVAIWHSLSNLRHLNSLKKVFMYTKQFKYNIMNLNKYIIKGKKENGQLGKSLGIIF